MSEECGRGLKSSFRTNSQGRLTGPGECGGSQQKTRAAETGAESWSGKKLDWIKGSERKTWID